MSSTDYELSPQHLPTVRFNTYGFLSDPGRAADLWTRQLANGEEIWTPPAAHHLAPPQRARWLATEHATAIGRARLFYVAESALDVATRLGADLSEGDVEPASPPSRYGLALVPAGLGYSSDDMRLIACCWSPLDAQSWWVSWWADTREFIAWMQAEHGEPPEDAHKTLRLFGNLYYITAGRAWFDSDPERFVAAADDHTAEPTLGVTPAGAVEVAGPVPGELRGAWSTTLGLWAALARGPVVVERQALTTADRERDHQVGITPSKIHYVY